MNERKRPRILIADDSETNILVLQEFLSGEYDITAAPDGPQALASACEAPPDLVLLDIMMPGLDGFEVCRRLKADERTAEIPVIFITALDDAAAESRGLELGAIDFIAKPFNPGLVRARVRNHIALREAARLREDVERIMRHDLKSPLSTVVTVPRLLLMDDNHTPSQREMLQRVEDAGYTLLAMINLSTTLFRMERGDYVIVPEKMDLASVARKVLDGFEDTARMRRIRLRLLVDGREEGAACPFMGEELLCHSMLANLVANALDASPRGEAVDVAIDGGAQGGVRIRIVNAGEVPRELRDRFFEKYATAGKARGTGLGTYSARLIARAHGGDAAMECGEGRVSITVDLPA